MKLSYVAGTLLCTVILLTACTGNTALQSEKVADRNSMGMIFTRESKIEDVKADPVFEDYGRLLFPVNDSYYSGNTLEDLQLTYYSHIDPDETVEIVDTLYARAKNGEEIFYDIYPMFNDGRGAIAQIQRH